MRKKLTMLLLAVVMVFSLSIVAIQSTNGKLTAKASTTVDVTDLVTFNDWSDAEGQGAEMLPLCIGEVGKNELAASFPQGTWNDNGKEGGVNYVANGNQDILEYIYINKRSVRAIVDENASTGKYAGTSGGVLSYGGVFAPVHVEFTRAFGLILRILNVFIEDTLAAEGNVLLTYKQGLHIYGENDTIYTFGSSLIYSYNKGNWEKVTVAVPTNEVNVTDLVTLHDWNDAENQGAEMLPLCIGAPGSNSMTATFPQGTWNDNGKVGQVNYVANGNQDILEYIYINERSVREIVAENASTGKYAGTSGGVLSLGGVFAPVHVELTRDFGLILRILNVFIEDTLTAEGKVVLTYKQGLHIYGENDTAYFFGSNLTYTYKDGNWEKKTEESEEPEEPEEPVVREEVDITDLLYVVNHNDAAGDGCTYIELHYLPDGSTKTAIPVLYTHWWNDDIDGSRKAQNDGIDIMDYIYINGVSAREEIKKNVEATDKWIGNSDPMSWGSGWFAPIAIDQAAGQIVIKVLKEYAPTEGLELTFKAGLAWVCTENRRLVVSEDVTYVIKNGVFKKKHTLSFDCEGATVDPIAVTEGDAIGSLPVAPDKDGHFAYWQIDGENIGNLTVYNYGEDKVATPVYVEGVDVSDMLTFHRIDDFNDCKEIPLTLNTAGGENEMIPADGINGNWWNDNLGHATINYGFDVMEYISVNGKTLRTIINENSLKPEGERYLGTAGPMSYGPIYAPVSVETGISGLYVRILNKYVEDLTAADGRLTLTYKKGLVLKGVDVNYYFANDLTYILEDGAWYKADFTLAFEGLNETVKAHHGNAIGTLPAVPENEGYDGEWAIGDEAIDAETCLKSFDKVVTATAKYTAKQYTLSFEDYEGTSFDPVTVTFDSAIGDVLPALPAVTGMIGEWKVNGEVIEASTVWTIADNATATASYRINQFELSFENGEEVIDPITVVNGLVVGELPALTAKEGYSACWMVGEDVISADTVWAYVTDKTALAVYTANSYTLSFENGEEVIDAITVTYDAVIGELPAITEKTGHTACWMVGETVITAETVWATASDSTAVAHYEAISYTVTFDGANEITVAYGEKVTAPATAPTKESTAAVDYVFDGWYNGEDKWDFASDVVEGDLDLVAKFTEKARTYTVTFEVVGHTVTIDPATVEYGATYDLGNILEGKDVSGYTYSVTVGGEEKVSVKVLGDVTVTVTFTPVGGATESVESTESTEQSGGCMGSLAGSGLMTALCLASAMFIARKKRA